MVSGSNNSLRIYTSQKYWSTSTSTAIEHTEHTNIKNTEHTNMKTCRHPQNIMIYANCWANSRSEVSRIEVTNSSSVSTKMNNTIIHLFHEIWLNLGTCQHVISTMFFPMNVDTWPYRKCSYYFMTFFQRASSSLFWCHWMPFCNCNDSYYAHWVPENPMT